MGEAHSGRRDQKAYWGFSIFRDCRNFRFFYSYDGKMFLRLVTLTHTLFKSVATAHKSGEISTYLFTFAATQALWTLVNSQKNKLWILFSNTWVKLESKIHRTRLLKFIDRPRHEQFDVGTIFFFSIKQCSRAERNMQLLKRRQASSTAQL